MEITKFETGYSFWKGLRKMGVQLIIFGAPIALEMLPEAWMNLTLSSIINMVVNHLKFQYNASKPNQ